MLKRFIFLQEDKVSEASTAALEAGLDIMILCQSHTTQMSAQHMMNHLCNLS